MTSADNLAVWPRDLVLMRHRHRLSDKTTVIGLRSVVDESSPPRSPWLLVRANITGGGFIIQGLATGKTRVSFVSQANFGGWAGVYGSYGMHVEQMALLISLKNYVHSEVMAVAGPSSPVSVLASSSTSIVKNGFDAKLDLQQHQQEPQDQVQQVQLQQLQQNSYSPSTGFFMADVAVAPKLTQVVSQTFDPFNSATNSPFVPPQLKSVSELSPLKKPLRKLMLSTDLGDSEEEGLGEPSRDLLSNFPVRVWYDLPRPPLFAEQALQCREVALRVVSEGPAEGWVQLAGSKGVAVWQKKMGEGKPSMVRGVMTDVPCSAGYFVSQLGSAERAAWDPMFMRGHLVEVIDDFTHVSYERYHPIFPTSGRDFVALASIIKRPDGSYLKCGTTVEHVDCPEVSKKHVIRKCCFIFVGM